MAIDSNINKKTVCGTSHRVEENTGHLVHRQDNKCWGQNWTTNYGQHTERKTTLLVWRCSVYGPSAHTTAGTVLAGYKRGPGWPRENWKSTVSKDLQKMWFIGEEAEVAAFDRHGWHRSVAQCVQLDVGWIKVKVLNSFAALTETLHISSCCVAVVIDWIMSLAHLSVYMSVCLCLSHTGS